MIGQPVCKGCGKPITGRYLTALAATWHPEHFVCTACGRPITDARFKLNENLPYHEACYAREIAPRCAYCGKPLTDSYLVDYWGTKFCREHQGQYASCDFCGRLILPADRETGAEVIRCRICRASVIETAEDARPLFRQVIQWVSRQGLHYHQLPLSLELCGKTKLLQYLRENGSTHSLGATMGVFYTQDGQVTSAEVSGVAVLYGLPSIVFESVVAHELGHVWLIVQGVPRGTPWREEGFCELLSYNYLHFRNTPESRYRAENMERNPDPIYGEGFRRMRAQVEQRGFERFVTEIERSKRWP